MSKLLGKIVEVEKGLKGRITVCIKNRQEYCISYLNPQHTKTLTSWEEYQTSVHFYGDHKDEIRLTKEEFEQVPVYGYDIYRHIALVKVYGDLKPWFINSLEDKY